MKMFCLGATTLLLSIGFWGQAAPTATVDQPTSQSTSPSRAQSRPSQYTDTQHSRGQMGRQLELELEEMRAKLAAMKANDANIKDPAVRKHLQLDAELWDLMFSNVNELTSALVQMQRQRSFIPSPAAQLYRRQLLQGRVGAASAAVPAPSAVQTPALDHR